MDNQHPVQIRVASRRAHRAEILVAAYDLFGEFSIITGLMTAYGLNIRDGQVFSYHRGPGRATPWGTAQGGLIVDVFTVEYAAERPFDSTAQAEFTTQLTTLIQLLHAGQLQEARASLSGQIIDTMRTSPQAFSAHLFPVQITIDNEASADWTVVHIHADDTPAFLYSLSNALAMRDIYIYRVNIASTLGKVHDEIFVRWRRGGKITSAAGQRELHLMVMLIKQFTHFLTVAPDPVMALQHFDRLVDRLAGDAARGEDLQWLWEDRTLKALATVLGSSHFLWEDFLRLHYDTLLPIFKDLRAAEQRLSKDDLTARLQQALQGATTSAAANTPQRLQDQERFVLIWGISYTVEAVSLVFPDELADLAEVVWREPWSWPRTRCALWPPTTHGWPSLYFALFGLGSSGGRELGYASDLKCSASIAARGRPVDRNRLLESVCRTARAAAPRPYHSATLGDL